jgi:hypothetical protein
MYFRFKRNKMVVIVVMPREVAIREILEVTMDIVADGDMEVGEVDTPPILTVEKLSMYQDFVPNHALFVGTSKTQSML